MCQTISLSIKHSVCLSNNQSVYPTICLYIKQSVCLSNNRSVYQNSASIHEQPILFLQQNLKLLPSRGGSVQQLRGCSKDEPRRRFKQSSLERRIPRNSAPLFSQNQHFDVSDDVSSGDIVRPFARLSLKGRLSFTRAYPNRCLLFVIVEATK